LSASESKSQLTTSRGKRTEGRASFFHSQIAHFPFFGKPHLHGAPLCYQPIVFFVTPVELQNSLNTRPDAFVAQPKGRLFGSHIIIIVQSNVLPDIVVNVELPQLFWFDGARRYGAGRGTAVLDDLREFCAKFIVLSIELADGGLASLDGRLGVRV